MDNKLKIHTLRSSSKGNAEIICNKNTKILVDCGISGKALEESLGELGLCGEDIDAVVVTHEHTDHIKGVGILSRKHNVPIYANEQTWNAMRSCIGKVAEENIRIFRNDTEFKICDIGVRAFEIPHDASDPVGYTFRTEEQMVAVATDMGQIRENVLEAVTGCDEILLEANYDLGMLEMGPYPYELKRRIKSKYGHLCNDDAGDFAAKLAASGTRKIILGHLSWENNYPDLAFFTVRNILEARGFAVGKNIDLSVAQRDKTGDVQSYIRETVD